jgi:hypothetical protein
MDTHDGKRKFSRPRAEQFYILTYPARELASGREFLNQEEVCQGSGSAILYPPSPFQRGFRKYRVRPRFRVSKRLGRKPYDVEPYSEYWLVSDRAKHLFDEINKTDFTYLAVDTEVDPGSDPTTYWLCDIVSVLDALDEARSAVMSSIADDGSKIHLIGGDCSLAFDETLVGHHCVFRMKTSWPTLIGSENFKAAFRKAQLTGLSFMEAFEPPFDKIGTVTALPPGIGTIKPDGRGKQIFFSQEVLNSLGGSLKVGDAVRVQGRHNKHYRYYYATRLERI